MCPAGTKTSPLSLHDALPISESPSASILSTRDASSAIRSAPRGSRQGSGRRPATADHQNGTVANATPTTTAVTTRSEEHTSELQSRENLVCRLLLEKKKKLKL